MLFIFIEAVLVLLLKGTDGQEIVFDPLKRTSPCSQGLRSGTDKFMLTGTVGRNYNALVSSGGWFKFVTLHISVGTSQFTRICEISIGTNGTFCGPSSTNICYCDHINYTTGSAHFVVNYPAREDYSNGTIRAQWQNTNNSTFYSLNTTLPAIYDVNKASLTLSVNGVPVRPTSAPLMVHFVSNKNNTLQLCCTNSASPCYPTITLNEQVFESQTGDCVNHTVFAPNISYTTNVTSSYSVCTKNDHIIAGSGVITTVEENESTTTETTIEAITTNTTGTTEVTTLVPSNSSATTPGTTEVTTFKPSSSSTTTPDTTPKPHPPPPPLVLIICLCVFIPLGIAVIIIVAVYYFKKKSRTPKNVTGIVEAPLQDQNGQNPKQKLTQEPEQELQQEPQQKPQQEPQQEPQQNSQVIGGYRNNGSDETRTSPSNIDFEIRLDNSQQHNTVEKKKGSRKHRKDKTKDGSASKEVPEKPRGLPALRSTNGGGQPPGESRPPPVEVTSSAAVKDKK